MPTMRSSRSLVAVLLAALAVPTAVSAQTTGLEDMVGARAGQAEAELQRRGYVNTGGQQGDDRSYTNWWNERRGQCVTIATMNGRYDSITPSTAPDCGRSAAGNRRSGANNRQWDNDDRRRDRYSGDAREFRHHMPARGISDFSELQAICRAEASGRYDRRPSELTVNSPVNQRDGAVVRGWFDGEGKRTTFFNCRFDDQGRFMGMY